MEHPLCRWLAVDDTRGWGTTAETRRREAPDPEAVQLDDRGDAEQIRFVQELSRQLRWLPPTGTAPSGASATWEPFCCHPNLTPEAMASFWSAADPAVAFSDAERRWLGRPHFGLLLVFIRLLRHQRQLLNALPARHLRHYYQQLGFTPKPGEPDRVTVAFTLAEGAPPLLLPAGSVLRAGEDAQGRERRYRTLSDLAINQARVSRLRSLQLERGIVSLGSIQEETLAAQRLDRMLELAYGEPGRSAKELAALLPKLRFCSIDGNPNHLHLDLQEFMQLIRLARQRGDDGSTAEWAWINRLLGVEELLRDDTLKDPRDFQRNVTVSLRGVGGGELDWTEDGLSEVNSLDDLYANRDGEAVKRVLGEWLTRPGCRLQPPAQQGGNREALLRDRLHSFEEVMKMKRHIDSQWQQVNWLLERCGKRRRQLPSWQLPGGPNSCSPAFAANLAKAWDCADAAQIPWPDPVAWPESLSGAAAATVARAPSGIPAGGWRYFLDLEALEQHYGLPLEDLMRLCRLAEQVKGQEAANTERWAAIRDLLRAAHRERWATLRRQRWDRWRDGGEGPAAFSQLLRQTVQALPKDAAAGKADTANLNDDACLTQLSPWLAESARGNLERFSRLLTDPGTAPRRLGWAEVVALLEGAQRSAAGEQPPELERLEWRQLHGREQEIRAEALAAGKTLQPCFWTKRDGVDSRLEPGAGLGFGVASRLLALAEGNRLIELSLAFTTVSGTAAALLASLQAKPGARAVKRNDFAGVAPASPERLGWGLNQALLVEVSTAEGWWALPITEASLPDPKGSDSPLWELKLALRLAPADPALAPLAAGQLPRLRLRLRPFPEERSGQRHWRSCSGFEGLRLARADLRVKVEGLRSLRLQQEGTAVDPREPFTPFGSTPMVGSCLYISHPELLDGDLEEISFSGTWKQLPADLAAHYRAYRGLPGLVGEAPATAQSFRMDLGLRLRQGGNALEVKGLPLFARPGGGSAADGLRVSCRLEERLPSAMVWPTPAAEREEDLREQARVWCWRLNPTDFGHGLFPALAASQAQRLAAAISDTAGRQALAMAEAMASKQNTLKQRYSDALTAAGATEVNPATYAVPEPYTPRLEGLTVGYSRSQALGVTAAGQVLRVHLFGEEEPLTLPPPAAKPEDAQTLIAAPELLPSHPHPGELWLELEGARPGLPVSLAFELAAGSARGARPTPAVLWEVRQGWQWRPLPVREDGTAGLLQSGLLRFSLPEEAPERLWIRACLRGPLEAYATLLAIQSQAVEAEAMPPSAEDGEEEPAEAAGGAIPQPLAPHSVTALEEIPPGIAAIHQPFSSRLGRTAETEAALWMRAAERLRHKGRALAGWDYERLLWEAFASQLHTVVCQPAREGQPLTVVVVPNLREQVPRNLYAPGAPADLLAAMEQHLRQRCPAEAAPVVRNATYMHVMAQLWVCLREGVDPAHAERELRQAVLRVLSPWCFDASAEVHLGGEVRVSDVAVAIDALPFVAYLERLRLFLVDPSGNPLRLDGQETISEELLQAPGPDVLLIAAPHHLIELVSTSTTVASLIGINTMRIELDFQVA
ncbi:MAG: hypothetical protein ACK5Q7_14290 [Cyanobacteriota bacterium]